VSLETFDFAAKKVERAGDKKSNVRSTLSDGLCRQSVCVPGIIGLSHARPNSGISGDLLSENEAKPAVI